MKNKIYYYSLGLVFMLASLSGCDEYENLSYDASKTFIQVDAPSASKAENDPDPVITTVLFGSGSNENGLTVNFQVNSSDPSRYTFTPSNGQVVIPAGEFSAEIILTAVNNFATDGDVEVEILLLESEGIPVGLGGEGINFHKKVVTITDDDCPLEINDWVGTYTVFENFTGGGNAPRGLNNFFGEVYQMSAALVPDDVTNSKVVWNNSPGFDVYFDPGTVMSFISCAGAVSFDAGFPRVALFRVFAFTGSTYDENDLVIQCTGPLATFGPYQFTLTKE